MIVGLAAAIAIPVGVLSALYVTEFAGRRSRSGQALRLALDLMQGLPSIVVGLFVFGLIVAGHGDFGLRRLSSASDHYAAADRPLEPGGAAARAGKLARGGGRAWGKPLAHGPRRDPADRPGGIVTGTILAIARAAGETAPLLLVDGIFTNRVELNLFGHGVPNLPVMIFTASEAADPSVFTGTWGAAFVLFAVIVIANIGARVLLARSSARMAG